MFADIIVQDRDERPIGLVDVKPRVAAPEEIRDWIDRLDHADPSILFGGFVDLENIHFFKRDVRERLFAPIVILKTRAVLSHYDPEFVGRDTRYGSIQIFQDLLETLVTAWLRDLAYHWKSARAPGTEDLASSGLLEMIEGGFARRKELVEQPQGWGAD